MRLLLSVLLFFSVGLRGSASGDSAESFQSLLEGDGPIAFTLEAPLAGALPERAAGREGVRSGNSSRIKNPGSAEAELTGVQVSVRGNTSRRETECTFPKLKLKLAQGGSVKIGTHCGEKADDALSAKYGRLANERSPQREALVYDLCAPSGRRHSGRVPRAITYVDKARPEPIVRHALLLEDDDDAMKRVKGTAEIPLETSGASPSAAPGATRRGSRSRKR